MPELRVGWSVLECRGTWLPRRARVQGSQTAASLSLRLKDLLGPVTRVKKKKYSGVTLNVARPDMNNYATLGVIRYYGIGGSKDFALWDLARRATLGLVLY